MKKDTFAKQITRIELAFSKRLDKKAIAVYWDSLGESFSDSEFSDVCSSIIKTELFFPRIAVFFNKKGDTGWM